ncbi:hypothetical protein Syun_019574 [Stephania yunnanensis]|uniref:Uncharacterized protein n=1 Tax=Stephania yunnanensis TaxID=152371 RepID=A0AAP0NW11_9MAGN
MTVLNSIQDSFAFRNFHRWMNSYKRIPCLRNPVRLRNNSSLPLRAHLNDSLQKICDIIYFYSVMDYQTKITEQIHIESKCEEGFHCFFHIAGNSNQNVKSKFTF